MLTIHLIQGGLSDRRDLAIAPGEDLRRREASQRAVVVLIVVPVEVAFEPLPSVGDAIEAARVVGLILGGLELCFAEGVVVTDPRPAVAGGDAMLAEQIQKAVCDHR